MWIKMWQSFSLTQICCEPLRPLYHLDFTLTWICSAAYGFLCFVLLNQGKAVFDPKFAENFDLNNLNPDRVEELCRVCHFLANQTDLVRPGSAQCLPSGQYTTMTSPFWAFIAAFLSLQNLWDSILSLISFVNHLVMYQIYILNLWSLFMILLLYITLL